MKKIGIVLIAGLLLEILVFVFVLYKNDVYREALFWAEDLQYSINPKSDSREVLSVDDKWVPKMPSEKSWWLKARIDIDTAQAVENLGVRIALLGSYDVYWDNNLIGRNGIPAVKMESEVSGRPFSQFIIPMTEATHGEHTLLLRISNHHLGGLNYKPVIFAWNLMDIGKYQSLIIAYSLAMAGVFLIVTIYFVFAFLINDRHIASLLFGVFSLLISQAIIVDILKLIGAYTYEFHYLRTLGIYLIVLLANFSLIMAYAYQLLKNKKWLVGAISLVILSAVYFFCGYNYSLGMLIATMTSLSLCLLLVFRGKSHDSRDRLIFSVGIVLAIVCSLVWFEFLSFYGFLLLAISYTTIHIRKINSQRAEQQRAKDLSRRLELELLKKNIQPHFLMNSLQSIIALIEESPKESIVLIEELAKEFSLLMEIASKKLITLKQEIELCRSHLKIMSLRKSFHFDFQVNSPDLTSLIPPAIIHTLIENGITHNRPINGHLAFELNVEKSVGFTKISVLSIGNVKSHSAKEGTGMRYVKARLQEAFSEHWSLESRPIETGWQTVITIDNE